MTPDTTVAIDTLTNAARVAGTDEWTLLVVAGLVVVLGLVALTFHIGKSTL